MLLNELSSFSYKRLGERNLVRHSLRGDAPEQFLRGIMCAYDELHQRAKTPDRRRTQNVQAGNGSLKTASQPWIALEATEGLRDSW